RRLQPQREEPRLCRANGDRLLDADDCEARQTFREQAKLAWLLVRVHDLQSLDVLDQAKCRLACRRATTPNYTDLERITHREGTRGYYQHAQKKRCIDERAKTQYALPQRPSIQAKRQCVLGGVSDQSFRVAHLGHDLVAAVDACRTADAFVLQPVAYVDAGWTDLHADAAVDAITEPAVARVSRLSARSPGLAAGMVVGDDERVAIEHHALEACVGTHVLAHLLAHETRVP